MRTETKRNIYSNTTFSIHYIVYVQWKFLSDRQNGITSDVVQMPTIFAHVRDGRPVIIIHAWRLHPRGVIEMFHSEIQITETVLQISYLNSQIVSTRLRQFDNIYIYINIRCVGGRHFAVDYAHDDRIMIMLANNI